MLERPEGKRLGEYLVLESVLSWEQLYHALSVMSSYPTASITVEEIEIEVARSLPRSLMVDASLQPVRLQDGFLVIACSEIPRDSLLEKLRQFSSKDPMFVLVTPANLAALRSHADAFVVVRQAA